MKKSLSLLVAIAMVFSMFATVVSAAEEQQPTAGEYLNELGVILGNQDGDLKEDQTWKRQDIVVLLSRLFGAEDEAKGAEKTHEFKDVTDKNYDGYISWAVEEGLVKGKSATVFGFGDELENRDFYLLVLRALGQEVEYDKVGGAAVEAGLAPEDTDFDAIPLRGETYTAIVAALKTPVGEHGETLEELLGLVEAAAVTAVQKGVKTVEVKFNKAVDADKVSFAVKNGVANRTVVKKTFSDDKKAVILEVSAKLLDGASSVTVSGLSEKALVADFTAAAERVTEIAFTSDKVALGTLTTGVNAGQPDYQKASVGYKILNQFGEDVTKSSGGSLSFQVGKMSTSGAVANGVLTLTASAGQFYVGEQVYVTAILNLNTYGVTATKTFTVGEQAKVDSVEILSVYHADNKELYTNSTFSDFIVLVDAKDQYGNAVTLDQFKAGVFASVSNGTLFGINKDTDAVSGVGPNNDKLGIRLSNPPQTGGLTFAGVNTIRIQTLFGQKSDSIDVEVKKASALTTFTLEAPSDIVAAGETVKIPFTAYDQDGNALTNYSDLNGKVNLYASNDLPNAKTITLKQDYATKKAYVEWVAGSTKALYILSANVVNTASNNQLQINVEELAKAESLAGFKDVNNTLALNATVTIKPANVVVKDQHGRDMSLAKLIDNGYELAITAKDGAANVVTGFGNLDSTTTNAPGSSVTLTAAAKGTEQVKLELLDANGNSVAVYEQGFAFNVVDNSSIESYEVSAPEKISNQPGHAVTVKVNGKRGSQSIELHASAYTVAATAPLVATGNQLSATNFTDNAKATYTVTIIATGETFTNEINVSKEALVATKLEQRDASGLTASGLVVKGALANVADLAKVLSTIKIVDQFGVELTGTTVPSGFYVTLTGKDNVGGTDIAATNNGLTYGTGTNGVQITGVDAVGDSYTIVVSHSSNTAVKLTIKVVAES